jgi:hypothetical protein
MFMPIQIEIRILIGIKQFRELVTALPLYNVFLSHPVSNVSHVFSILNSILKFSGKKSSLSSHHLLVIDTDPDPAKRCGSDPIRIRIHNTGHMTTSSQEIMNNNLQCFKLGGGVVGCGFGSPFSPKIVKIRFCPTNYWLPVPICIKIKSSYEIG